MSRPQRAVGGEDQVVVVELLAPGLPRPMPVWSRTRSFGVNRAASCIQLKTSDRGTTTSDGGGRRRFLARPAARRASSRASTWTVLPRPMSSARQPPKPNSLEEVEPAEALALIAAELAVEPGRRVRGLDALELAEPLADLLEPLVESRLGLLGQQGVEQADLRPPEPEVVPLRRAQPGEGHVLLEPLLRQQAEAAVAQRHEVSPRLRAASKVGQRHLLAAEVDPAVQLEPVDAGRHLELELARLAVQLPLGLDAPALLEEGPRGLRQVACEQLQGLALAVVGPAVEADLLEPGREGPLGRRVAQQQPSLVGLEDAPGRAPRGHDVAVVLEGEVADEPVLIPVGHPAPVVAALDLQVRPRRRRDLFVPQVLRQVEPGQVRQPEQFREELLLLLGGDGHFTLLSQQRDPLEGVEVKERCDAILPEHEPAAQQQQGSLQRQSLLGATELAGDRVRLAGIVRRHLQPELPGAGVIPAERPHRAVRLRFPQQAPARGAEHRQQGLARARA